MGWTLTSTNTKNCGCRVETKVHDDFPTSDTDIILCKECSRIKKEEEEKIKQEETDLYNRFIQAVNNTEVQTVPRKKVYSIINANRFRFRGSKEVLIIPEYSIFKYEMVRNRYYINLNAVRLFYEYELDKYYSLYIK